MTFTTQHNAKTCRGILLALMHMASDIQNILYASYSSAFCFFFLIICRCSSARAELAICAENGKLCSAEVLSNNWLSSLSFALLRSLFKKKKKILLDFSANAGTETEELVWFVCVSVGKLLSCVSRRLLESCVFLTSLVHL